MEQGWYGKGAIQLLFIRITKRGEYARCCWTTPARSPKHRMENEYNAEVVATQWVKTVRWIKLQKI